MRGRWQALGVATLASGSLLFGWVGAATVALVTLRRGHGEGGWVALWALLPAVIFAGVTGDIGTVLLLAGTYLLAVILRESVSLSLTVMASVPLAILSGFCFIVFSATFIESLSVSFNDLLADLNKEIGQENVTTQPIINSLTTYQLVGLLATGNAVIAVLSVMLGRYWQSILYNPGGFSGEFRGLKVPRLLAVALCVVALLLLFLGSPWVVWSAVAVLPLTIAGFALIHSYARHSGRRLGWLAFMYVLWFVFDIAKWLWVGLALIDTFAEFRERWKDPSSGGPQGESGT